MKKYPKGESFFVVPAGNKRIWFISKDYKERFLRPVKILYFGLGWVEILMTPLLFILGPWFCLILVSEGSI